MRLPALLTGLLLACAASTASAELGANDWLLKAPDDQARFDRLQDQFGGFSPAMREVGERYRVLHDAVERGNRGLALYHWDKIRDAIKLGYERRPGRQANADRIFLDDAWPKVREALASGEAPRMRQGFEQARGACLACHVAEEVPFMNEQKLFELRTR